MYFTRLSSLTALAAALVLGQNHPQTDSPHAGAHSDQAKSNQKLTSMDRTFVTKATEGGSKEVEMAQHAVEKASRPEVKQFAQELIDDHTKANNELIQIAGDKGIALNNKTQFTSSPSGKLMKYTGAEFDRAYMKEMVSDHEKDVALFEKQSTSGTDSDLRAYAAKTLPKLREHLEKARTLNQQK